MGVQFGSGFSLSGAMAALATPWQSGGSGAGSGSAGGGLDMGGLERLVERIVSGGADGISPAGSTGEGALLTRAQRIELTKRVRQLTPAGLPVITGLPLTTLTDGPAELDALAAAGADAALVAPPSYYPLSDDAVRKLYAELADTTPLPLVLYNIPVFTKVRLSPAVVGWLAGHPAVIGIKDSSRDMEYQQQVIAATAAADFAVLTGTDSLLVASLVLGAAGTIAASVNLVPELPTGIYRAYGASDMKTALRLQEELARIVAICRPGLFPAGWKAALEIAGVCERVAVPPGTPLPAEDFGRLGEQLASAGLPRALHTGTALLRTAAGRGDEHRGGEGEEADAGLRPEKPSCRNVHFRRYPRLRKIVPG
jgi:4-hydroxy-tetrahydrodipicolinate synthase